MNCTQTVFFRIPQKRLKSKVQSTICSHLQIRTAQYGQAEQTAPWQRAEKAHKAASSAALCAQLVKKVFLRKPAAGFLRNQIFP